MSFGTLIYVVVFGVVVCGAIGGVLLLGLLRKMGMKEPDVGAEIASGARCEMCEQTTVEKTDDGRLSCYGCGHVAALGAAS